MKVKNANAPHPAVDAGMDLHLPVRVSQQPVWLVWCAGLLIVPLLWWFGYVGCAVLLAMAVLGEAMLAWRRQLRAPVALCGQGMRWWLVNQEGELCGPYWLDEQTRLGASWMTLCLRDADKRYQYVLLGRWNMATETWRELTWRVLEQAQHLRKVRGA